MEAFVKLSIYTKNKKYEPQNIDQSIALVKSLNEYLKYLVDQIRNYCDSLSAHLNGPEGSISEKMHIYMEMMEWGLKQLK